jgi:hypothetical protein
VKVVKPPRCTTVVDSALGNEPYWINLDLAVEILSLTDGRAVFTIVNSK